MITEQPPKKPTYRELWWDQGATLLDLWQGGTKLDEHTLSLLWNHSLVPSYVAEQALRALPRSEKWFHLPFLRLFFFLLIAPL
jgi:hypothetical protein